MDSLMFHIVQKKNLPDIFLSFVTIILYAGFTIRYNTRFSHGTESGHDHGLKNIPMREIVCGFTPFSYR